MTTDFIVTGTVTKFSVGHFFSYDDQIEKKESKLFILLLTGEDELILGPITKISQSK